MRFFNKKAEFTESWLRWQCFVAFIFGLVISSMANTLLSLFVACLISSMFFGRVFYHFEGKFRKHMYIPPFWHLIGLLVFGSERLVLAVFFVFFTFLFYKFHKIKFFDSFEY